MLKKVTITNVSSGKSEVTLVDTDTQEKALIGSGVASNETATVEDIVGLDETIHRLSSTKASVDDSANFFSGRDAWIATSALPRACSFRATV